MLIKGVPTDCGSHTHTLVPDAENGRVLLYVASYTAARCPCRPTATRACASTPDGPRAHQKISVVEVPLANPAAADVVSEPTFPQNDRGGTPGFNGCHDITVYMAIERAGVRLHGRGPDLGHLRQGVPEDDRADPQPEREFFHSAAFSWDGKTVIFGDEAGGGTGRAAARRTPTRSARCGSTTSGASTTCTTRVEPWLSSWKVPRDQTPAATRRTNCTMHNFNTLPDHEARRARVIGLRGRHDGGRLHDRRNPTEVGHHDPHGANTWSAYWYNGLIYTNDGAAAST